MTTKEKLLEYIRSGQYKSMGKAAVDLKLSKATVQKYINYLLLEGLIESQATMRVKGK